MKSPITMITREKHLDHMVRVVPFIVVAYAIQCYFISQMGGTGFAINGLFFLGGCLISMITAFVTYDLTHTVNFKDEECEVSIKWLNYHRTIKYADIAEARVTEPGQTFSTLKLKMHDGRKFGFYFIDDADRIKAWLEKKRIPELQMAA